ncbi:hypothetical protein RHMOL_Rhmol04G0223800 [Rhododendron molle]|uniref:Uncharacterized protein n=1 Tax=Rhododendron molle TaxID=49168 RepID=A0ACC0P4A4_RHOML|nr:hypothetical protein RHMOL_Rhmol04G0223800 [Rhododendron molle]
MADHGGNEGEGEVVDQPDCEQKAGDEENPRAVEKESRARVETGVVEPSSEPVDSGMVAEGNLGGISGSGAGKDDTGPGQTPPRDSAKGKGVVIEEEYIEEEQIEREKTTDAATVEIREEDIAFRPPVTAATSSRHVPITFDDIAEHAPDELLAKLLEIIPCSGSMF